MTVCDSGTFQLKTMSSDDLAALYLKPGHNNGRYVIKELSEVIEFSVFLYNEDDKLVVTDIDGTITESDIKVSKIR